MLISLKSANLKAIFNSSWQKMRWLDLGTQMHKPNGIKLTKVYKSTKKWCKDNQIKWLIAQPKRFIKNFIKMVGEARQKFLKRRKKNKFSSLFLWLCKKDQKIKKLKKQILSHKGTLMTLKYFQFLTFPNANFKK